MAAAELDRGFGAIDAGDRLIAVGLGLLQELPARGVARDQLVLTNELQLRARGRRLRGDELGLGLLDGRLLGGDLMTDPADGRLLGGDLAARRIDREPIVAVVDGRDHVAGMDAHVVGHEDAGEIAGNLSGQRRVVGLHVGVIGRNREAPDRPPVVAEPAGDRDGNRQQRAERDLAAAAALRRLADWRFRPDLAAWELAPGPQAQTAGSAGSARRRSVASASSTRFGAGAGVATTCKREGMSRSWLRYMARTPLPVRLGPDRDRTVRSLIGR